MNLRQWLSLPASVLLACQSVTAVRYANTSSTSTEDLTTIIHVTSTKFITEFRTSRPMGTAPLGTAPATTMGGPQILDAQFLNYVSYYWTQKYNATTVGTVQIIINEATNKTTTTTKYHTEFRSNGTGTDSVALLSRTDINAAGTVTQVILDLFNSTTTVTYPTPYVQYDHTLSFYGNDSTSLPGQGVCCHQTWFTSSTPSHSPFPSPTGTTNPIDPSGWLYVAFTGFDNSIPLSAARSTDIVSLWGSQVQLTQPQCTYSSCSISAQTAPLAASWGLQQVGIFATETTTLSIPDSSTSQPIRTANPISATALPDSLPSDTESGQTPSQSTAESASPSVETSVSSMAPHPPVAVSEHVSAASAETLSDQSPAATSTSQRNAQSPEAQSDQASPSQAFSFSPQTTQNAAPPAIIIGSSTVTQQSNSAFVVGSQTLLPGSSIVVGEGSSTTVVALQTNDGGDTVVVVGSSSSLLQSQITPAAQASPSQAPNIVVAGETATRNSNSAFVIGGQTLSPGGSITVGSGSSTTVVALANDGSSAVVQDGTSSFAVPVTSAANSQTPAPAIVIGSSSVTQQSNSAFVIGSQTLTPGGSITLGSGASTTVVALGSDGSSAVLQAGSSSFVVPVVTQAPPPQAPAMVIGDSTITRQSDSAFIVGGETLTPGGAVTLGSGPSATVLALATNGNSVMLQDGSTSETIPVITPGPAAALTTPAPSIVVDGSTITAQSGTQFIVSGQTLTPGGSITVGSSTIGLQSSGSNLVLQDGTSATTFTIPSSTSPPGLTVNGNTITAQSGSLFIISGQTLTPGGTITIGSETLALQTSSSNLIVVYDGTSSSTLSPATTPLPAFTFDNSIITANSASAYIVDGQTLTPGGDVVVSGTTIRLGSDGGELIVGTSTVDLEATSSGGVGGLIWSGLGAGTTGAGRTTSSSAASTSAATPAATTTRSGAGRLEKGWLGAGFLALLALAL